MNAMTIRKMHLDDVPVVAEMVRDSFDSQFWPFMIYAQHGIAAFLSVPLQYPGSSPEQHSLVLSREEGVQGFADFRVLNDRAGFLSYICVKPTARGHGVATNLIMHFLSHHPHLTELRLDVFRGNAPALAMYKKLGFESRGSAAWVTRALPAPHGSVAITSLAISLAAYSVYGFCEFDVLLNRERVKVGLLGPNVLRCSTIESFGNDKLLASLHQMFPHADSAFAVVSEAAVADLQVAHQVVNLSDRMTLDIR